MLSKLIALLVIVLGVVAIAQLVRVYELSSKLRKRGEHEITDRDNNLNGRMMFMFVIALYAFFLWLVVRYGWTGRGEAASTIGRETDWLLNVNFVIIIAVFLLTNTLLFYFSYRYVRKEGVKAFYYPHNNKLEMLWTVVPACVLAVIIILGLKKWNDATSAASDDAIRVELYSKQFDWTARYSGYDNMLGRFDYKLTTDKNELGLMTTATIDSAIFAMEHGVTGIDSLEAKLNNRKIMLVPEEREKMETDLSRKQRLIRLLYQMQAHHDKKMDRAAQDDIIQKDTLYLCANKEYEFNFRAKDVIHSAYFPHFRAQINTVPGMTTRFKFTPDITTKEMRVKKNDAKFNYVLMCNKICGGAHYKMKMIVVVLSEKEYNKWMKGAQAKTFKTIFSPAPSAPAAPVAGADTLAVAVDTVAMPAPVKK
ncbi:MAG: cytochrome c oxidase subunit II [Flavobacteriia bacterium]|jgi:cytochrome c oxidase subunit 2|nr:cytochrome c oxidase subunit II [Cryomorphaceae bacterium]